MAAYPPARRGPRAGGGAERRPEPVEEPAMSAGRTVAGEGRPKRPSRARPADSDVERWRTRDQPGEPFPDLARARGVRGAQAPRARGEELPEPKLPCAETDPRSRCPTRARSGSTRDSCPRRRPISVACSSATGGCPRGAHSATPVGVECTAALRTPARIYTHSPRAPRDPRGRHGTRPRAPHAPLRDPAGAGASPRCRRRRCRALRSSPDGPAAARG
jgi:hypothetical protein